MTNQPRSIMITERGLDAFSRHLLSKVDSLVLWHIVKTLPIDGAVVSKADMGKELKTSRVQLTNVIKRFCETGFLVRGPRVGVSYHYRINPAFIKILPISAGEDQ